MEHIRKITFLLLVMTTIVLTSCKHDRNHPGYAYMPDMYYSEAYETYTPNPVFSDSITLQAPAEGSIPRGYMPYPYEGRSLEAQQMAGAELINPLAGDTESLSKGKELYGVYCMVCHGPSGDGKGHLYTSGKYPAMPTSLIEPYVQDKPDGEIYHVITKGSVSGLMGAHGPQIKPEDRWKIINYVRELAKK